MLNRVVDELFNGILKSVSRRFFVGANTRKRQTPTVISRSSSVTLMTSLGAAAVSCLLRDECYVNATLLAVRCSCMGNEDKKLKFFCVPNVYPRMIPML